MLEPLENWRSDLTLRTFHTGMYMGLIRGRTMQKCADDLDRYDEVIQAGRPDVVIETGTRYGGSALWFADRVSEVISVDFQHQMTPQMVQDTPSNVTYVEGDSKDPGLVSRVRELVQGKRVMVSLDSDHHAPHVFEEIVQYGQLVTVGCHMVVEDACFDMWTGEDSRRGGRNIPELGGPLKAMRSVALEVDPRWKRDLEVEAWTQISHSPCGWWERVG